MSLARPVAPGAGVAAVGRDMGIRHWIGIVTELTKARITFFVSFTVATGYFVFTGHVTPDVLAPMAGVFLLACGSAALNQVQEARIDARMERTRSRPIPSGRISRDWALFVALTLIASGLYVLASIPTHTWALLGLGTLAVVWYNGVYLVLKRVTAFAVVPGSVIGAIPPVIGWSAGGGVPLDPQILEIAFLFFLWQIPHFWLLLLLYGKEYEDAGLPSPTRLVTRPQFRRITFVWILAVAATGLVVAVGQRFGVPWNLLALAASAWLVFSAVPLLKGPDDRKTTLGIFLRINLYALAMMILLSGNSLLGRI
jgi:protoheme IX farnesyltransferase